MALARIARLRPQTLMISNAKALAKAMKGVDP
jgi:hypothetical protein